jgi:hypothetical protein
MLGEDCGRAALLAGAIAGDASAGFGLDDAGRMACKRGQIRRGAGISQRIRVCRRYCLGAVGALPGESTDLCVTLGGVRSLRHALHAMVLAVSAAARRQTGLSIDPQSEEGRDERKAKSSQQQDGEESAQ